MKILYINALYSPFIQGGAELSLKVLVEGMQQAGHEVVVLSLKPDGPLETDQVEGIKVYRAALSNRYWPFTKERPGKLDRILWHLKDRYNPDVRPVMKAILEQERPDLVSCHNLVGWSVAVWDEIKKAGIPIVQVLHDLYLLCPNSDMFKDNHSCQSPCFSCSLLRKKHRALSEQVDAVVGISHFILQRFEQHGYFSKAQKKVIYNTREIPLPPFPPAKGEDTPFNIGFIGTWAEKKGIEWLIRQFLQLSDPSLHLSIAGGGKQEYEQYLRHLGKSSNISFVGYVEPSEFYKSIDLLVVPSIWEEPLGMVAIEALAYHVPVLASRVGGLQETIQEEINGLLCDPTQENSLGEALLKIVRSPDLYKKLQLNARPSVEKILNKQRMIDEYITILQDAYENNHQ